MLSGAFEYGLRNPPVRWVMLASVFTDGVSIYAFYAMQPYLLQLYGDPKAYGVAGLAAAIVGGAQIGGGFLVPHIARALPSADVGASAGDRRLARSSSRSIGLVPRSGGDRTAGRVGARVRRR